MQLPGGLGDLFLVQEPECDGTDIFRLPLRPDLPVLRAGVAVGFPHVRRKIGILPRVVRLSEDLRDPGQQVRRTVVIGRRHLRRAEHHGLLHDIHGRDVGLQPLAEVEALIGQVLFPRIGHVLDPGLLRAAGREVQPAAHHLIILLQDRRVAVGLVEGPGHQNAGVAPSRGALQHRGDRAVAVVGRRDIWYQAILFLRDPEVRQPFAQHRVAVGEHHPCRGKSPGIARPSRPLSRRAVRRHVAEVGLHAPEAVQEQAVDILVSASESAGLLHLRVDSDGREGGLRQVRVRLDLRITEPEDAEGRLVDIQPFLARVHDLLGDAAVLVAVPGIEVGLGEIAVLIQGLAVP